MSFQTQLGSLASYNKGTIELDDDLRKYAFSNIFEVAANSRPYERVAVVKNLNYVTEVVRAEGSSQWYAAPHDEFAVVMDGEVEFNFVKLDAAPTHAAGAAALGDSAQGKKMGTVRARRGHQVLLPAGAAYQMNAKTPAVVIVQTSMGPTTVERWAEICVLSSN